MRFEKLYVPLLFAFCLSMSLVLLLTENGEGWAFYDANNFHIPVIQDLISSWPALSYKSGLIAMPPGYHWTIATICHLTGLSEIDTIKRVAFVFNSIVALLSFSCSWAIIRRFSSDFFIGFCCLVLCFASSYTIFSWAWAVTDLSSLASVSIASIVLVKGGTKRWLALAFSLIAMTGGFFRQNLVSLALAPGLWHTPRWFNRRRVPVFGQVAMITIPILVAAGFVILLLFFWGGISPPDRNHTGSTLAISVGLIHMLAFFGLISVPALIIVGPVRLLATFARFSHGLLLTITLGCFLVAWAAFSVGYDHQYGSIVWAVLDSSGAHFSAAGSILVSFVLALLGSLFFLTLIDASTDSKEMSAIVVCTALFLAPHPLMSLHYQRYLEPVAMFLIGSWVASLSLSRKRVAAITACYFVYFVLSTARILV